MSKNTYFLEFGNLFLGENREDGGASALGFAGTTAATGSSLGASGGGGSWGGSWCRGCCLRCGLRSGFGGTTLFLGLLLLDLLLLISLELLEENIIKLVFSLFCEFVMRIIFKGYHHQAIFLRPPIKYFDFF